MLFGHQNDTASQPATDLSTPQAAQLAPPPTPDPSMNLGVSSSDPAQSLPTVTVQPDNTEHSVLDQPSAMNSPTSTPPTPSSPLSAPSFPSDPPKASDLDSAPATPASDLATPAVPGDLLHLKQQALSQLSPLVSHLEQTPEEKFRTTMMLIQSTDNQALLQSAYEAAQAITDEKARAQALLDVVNEINYFTQAKPAA